MPLALDILADILTRPAFDQAELERERQVVLQEIGQARDTPDDIIFDHLQATIYAGQPMGWPILGDDATVAAFTQEDLAHLYGRELSDPQHDAGRFRRCEPFRDRASRRREICGAQAGRDAGAVARTLDRRRAARGRRSRTGAHDVRLPGLSQTDPEIYALQVYVTALGGGMSSRLFQEVREKRGLCYTISAFAQAADDSGVVAIYTGTSEAEAGQIAPVVAGEMAALAANPTEAEIARAKAQLKSGLLMGLERPSSRAEQIAGQMFSHGRVLSVAEQTAKLDEVDVAAVRRIGERLMRSQSPAMVSLGPIGQLESYDVFAGRFGGTVSTRAADLPTPGLRQVGGSHESTVALAKVE